MLHTNDTQNCIIIEQVDKIPFPLEITEIIKGVIWGEQEWQIFGLPAFNSKFCISQNELYLEESPIGNTKVQKSEFTGECGLSTVLINPNNVGKVYLLTFFVVFVKGVLVEAKLIDCQPISYDRYQAGYIAFNSRLQRIQSISNAWWFKWLYRPYYGVIKILGAIILTPLSLLIQGTVWSLEKLLFLKL